MIVHPLWLGTMPALLKAFLEQAFRPGFAMGKADEGQGWSRKLAGKSARIVVTMGMPALLYRWYFGAHGLKSLEQSILAIVGIKPSRHTLVADWMAAGRSGVPPGVLPPAPCSSRRPSETSENARMVHVCVVYQRLHHRTCFENGGL